jgi:hypothetical protein
MPWDQFKAETIRTVCKEFSGGVRYTSRANMIAFLRHIEDNGCQFVPICDPFLHVITWNMLAHVDVFYQAPQMPEPAATSGKRKNGSGEEAAPLRPSVPKRARKFGPVPGLQTRGMSAVKVQENARGRNGKGSEYRTVKAKTVEVVISRRRRPKAAVEINPETQVVGEGELLAGEEARDSEEGKVLLFTWIFFTDVEWAGAEDVHDDLIAQAGDGEHITGLLSALDNASTDGKLLKSSSIHPLLIFFRPKLAMYRSRERSTA